MITSAMVLSLLSGGIFLISALPKLRRPKNFILMVLEYRILPPYVGKLYGALLPPAELTLALFALMGILLRFTAIMMSCLLLSFIAAIGINIKRGRELDCGCLGVLKKRPLGKVLLFQDGLFLGGTLFIGITHTWISIESWSVLRLIGISNDESGFLFIWCIGIIGIMLFLRSFFPLIKKLFFQREI